MFTAAFYRHKPPKRLHNEFVLRSSAPESDLPGSCPSYLFRAAWRSARGGVTYAAEAQGAEGVANSVALAVRRPTKIPSPPNGRRGRGSG